MLGLGILGLGLSPRGVTWARSAAAVALLRKASRVAALVRLGLGLGVGVGVG